jgi:hypothetical protein
MTTATLTAPVAPAADALDAFQVTDEAEVRAFLLAHPFLEPLLGEVAAQLPRYFPGAPLRLEVSHDGQQLVVEALVPTWSVDAVEDALNAFAHQWWLAQFRRAQNRLVVTSAFG